MGITYTDKRTYTEDDLEQLFRSVDWLSANYAKRLKKALDNCSTVFTAWDGKHLVGLINAMDDGELTAYIHYLCVNPAYQKQGVGKTLLSHVFDKYSDYLTILLIAENEELIPYYSQQGFEHMQERQVFLIQKK